MSYNLQADVSSAAEGIKKREQQHIFIMKMPACRTSIESCNNEFDLDSMRFDITDEFEGQGQQGQKFKNSSFKQSIRKVVKGQGHKGPGQMSRS